MSSNVETSWTSKQLTTTPSIRAHDTPHSTTGYATSFPSTKNKHTTSLLSQPPILSHSGAIEYVDTDSYQGGATFAERESMRKILARRSSDMVPSKKGVVNLFEGSHFGLLVNYACIGFLNGLFFAAIYPFFKLYLNMEGYQVAAAEMIMQLPWSYKTFFGILSDHRPIFGYRRKSYILIGWFICFIALMIIAYSHHERPYFKGGELQRTHITSMRVIENPNAPQAGARFLVQIMAVCVGYVIADVACDGIMVELAQHEHIEVRGSAQSTIYLVRYSANLVASAIAAVCFNGSEYGGTFSWSLSYNVIFFTCGIVTIVAIIATILLLEEEPFIPEEHRHPLREMWRIFKQRAIWQLMAFHFLNSFLYSFSFSGIASIQEYWVHVQPLNNSIAGCVSTSLFVAATWLMKMYCLNTSWRMLMLVCSIFTMVVYCTVNLVVTFDVIRSQWFYLGGPQLAVIPDGMRHVIAGFVTVEIAEHGFEGATYSLLTTVHNLARPFATSMYNLVDSYFDVSDMDIATDTMHVRWQVAICVFISLGMHILGLFTLVLLPNQKEQAQELKYHGASSRLAGVIALICLIFTLTWATIINLLAIQSSTACLRITGGRGC